MNFINKKDLWINSINNKTSFLPSTNHMIPVSQLLASRRAAHQPLLNVTVPGLPKNVD